MLEQIFSLAAFIWLSIGTGIGLFIAALMRANDPPCVETCPKCQGVAGYETGPNDCDLCDATGKVRSK